MKKQVLLLLVFLLLASVSHAYTIEGNSVFIEDAQASLRVTPATAMFPSPDGYMQEFEVCNKTGTTTNLFGAYVFERDLDKRKAEYLTSEGYEWVEHEQYCFYDFEYETGVNPAPNIHQAECFYINSQQERITIWDMAFKTGDIETGTIQYDVNELVRNWTNVSSSFEERIIEDKFAYTYTSGKEILGESCETWRITYKPSSADTTEKWDLWLWAGDNWDCILDGDCLKELRLDPWWSGAGSYADPWIIEDCNQLQTLDSYTIAVGGPTMADAKNQYWKLGNNIDCAAFGDFEPIGSDTSVFYGNFDGQSYTISNITINENEVGNGGLFAKLYTDANIANFGLIDINSWNTDNTSTGVFGVCVGATVSEVYVDGAIIAGAGAFYVAGFGGNMSSDCNVLNSYITNATVTARGGTQRVAGFVSYSANDANLFNNYSATVVTAGAGADSGAFLGLQAAGTCTQNFWNSDIVIEAAEGCAGGSTGITTANMKKEASFTNWNFVNIWTIIEDVSYPTFYVAPYDGGIIDLNITTINGEDFKTFPVFAFGLDGNITIDFDVYSKDNNRLSIDLNYSTNDTEGSGTVIIEDLNLTATYCVDQDFATVSSCSYSWDFSDLADGNYMITGLLTDTEDVTDFNVSDGNFTITNDVNLTIYVPIDETTGLAIDTSTYSYIVKVLNARLTSYSGNTDTNYFSIPISEAITILVDTNVDAYYWGREYSFFYETAQASDTLQPYLAPLGSSVLTTVHTVSMATLTAIPNMRIKVFKDLPGGRTLINDSVTDGKGETAIAFVIADNYEIEVWSDSVLLYTENYVATSTTSNHYIYLPLGGGVTFPTIPNVSVRYLPALRERTSTDFNIQVIIASNNNSIAAARVTLYNGSNVTIYDTGIDALISSDGNTYIISVSDLVGLDIAYPIDANVTVWLIDGTTVTSREDSWTFYFLGFPEDSMIWLLTNGMRRDFACDYNSDAGLRTTCQPLFLIAIFIIFFAIGGLALNQFRNGTALAIMAIIMTSFFVYITWIPFVWGVLMAVAGIVIIITTSRVDM